MKNSMKIEFSAESKNEMFARSVIAAFCLEANPTVSELCDIKTAVSEAVTNCIVHAYDRKGGNIVMEASLEDDVLHILIKDFGAGIADVDKALEPFFTTRKEEERSGMGFTIMQTFMSEFSLNSDAKGTVVSMKKYLNGKENNNKSNA